ncbi:MAG: phosphomannomutase/phosphoglucomutase [Acidimicrobiaceae bacterium]|jgi:phosphomannomutase|nr:phosphomannomutase/phosphoglucomutase [Acidimicrobiaceae bacterium]|tara:strand:+ start:38447 stop:39835 length:1389 start_codon:yes stop_codon:yes gene_type:complete
MADIDEIFKSYDIRGLHPQEIDGDICQRVGSAFARFLLEEDPQTSQVVVGIDMRSSSITLSERFISGVVELGLDILFLGLSSTDMLYYASGVLGVPGAIFTASHNPAEYNGIKLCRAFAVPVGEGSGLERIKLLCSEQDESQAKNVGSIRNINLLDDFTHHVLSFVDPNLIVNQRIVADTANGMGGLVVPAVFEHVPSQIEILYEELDGSFPNHPADPLNHENLDDLIDKVLDSRADVGLAFDGDADRVFLIDEMGIPLSGSVTTAIVAKSILSHKPDATVIHNLICSQVVPEVILENGGKAVRSRVGHSHIKKLMAETDAEFAGEHSGHYYFKRNFRADSGIIAALIVLEYMSRNNEPLSKLREQYDTYSSTGEINFKINDQENLLKTIEQEFTSEDCDFLDGLTVNSSNWWFNLRSSNTEPLVRLNLEAKSQIIRDEILNVLQGIISSFTLDDAIRDTTR